MSDDPMPFSGGTAPGCSGSTLHTGLEPALALPLGSGVAAKTESGSTADFTASKRSVFGP